MIDWLILFSRDFITSVHMRKPSWVCHCNPRYCPHLRWSTTFTYTCVNHAHFNTPLLTLWYLGLSNKCGSPCNKMCTKEAAIRLMPLVTSQWVIHPVVQSVLWTIKLFSIMLNDWHLKKVSTPKTCQKKYHVVTFHLLHTCFSSLFWWVAPRQMPQFWVRTRWHVWLHHSREGDLFATAVYSCPLSTAAYEWRHLLQQRHRGLAESLNHSHGNAQSWECADKHKHSPYQNTQTWETTP